MLWWNSQAAVTQAGRLAMQRLTIAPRNPRGAESATATSYAAPRHPILRREDRPRGKGGHRGARIGDQNGRRGLDRPQPSHGRIEEEIGSLCIANLTAWVTAAWLFHH